MINYIKNFMSDDDGAITVDFVVLTAAICILGLLVLAAISLGATGLANEIQNSLGNQALAIE